MGLESDRPIANAIRTKLQSLTNTGVPLNLDFLLPTEDLVGVTIRVVSGTVLMRGYKSSNDYVGIGSLMEVDVDFKEKDAAKLPYFKAATTAQIAIIASVYIR